MSELNVTMTRAPRKSRVNKDIQEFILDQVVVHPKDIVIVTTKKFGVSRNTVNRYLDRLVKANVLLQSGATKARTYSLKYFTDESGYFDVTPELEEHIIFRNMVEPHIQDVSKAATDICLYAVSEMVNNVKDHSESQKGFLRVRRNARRIEIQIQDWGVGIFRKITNACRLNDEREAILELAKGKLTTDPAHHTGEGIFFTSRGCRLFFINSYGLFYDLEMLDDEHDMLIEHADKTTIVEGTWVGLVIDTHPSYTMSDIFKRYEERLDGYGAFTKTHVPVRLALYGNEQLVSRSQARRVLSRFNKFSEVMLDFHNVPEIGHAFADEIFRVFKAEHPEVAIIPIRTSEQVKEVIRRATRSGAIFDAPPPPSNAE